MIQHKKFCKGCGAFTLLFSKGHCKRCSMRGYKSLPKSVNFISGGTNCKTCGGADKKIAALKKSMNKPTDRYIEAKGVERVAMLSFWNTQTDLHSDCHCEECGVNLGNEMNPYCVAHVISKGADKSLQADTRNFVLLCPEHHRVYDNGDRFSMRIWKELEGRIMELKKESVKNI